MAKRKSSWKRINNAIVKKFGAIGSISDMRHIDAEGVAWALGDGTTLQLWDNKDVWIVQILQYRRPKKNSIVSYHATPTKIATEALRLYKATVAKKNPAALTKEHALLAGAAVGLFLRYK